MTRVVSISNVEAPERYDRENESQWRLSVEQRLSDVLLQTAPSAVSGSPSTLSSGNNNDYSIGPTVTILRLTPHASGSTLTGMTDGRDGREVKIVNLGSAVLTISHADTGSSEANRFITATGVDIELQTDQTALAVYDASSQRWRVSAQGATPAVVEWIDGFGVDGITGTGGPTNLSRYQSAAAWFGSTLWIAPQAGSITGIYAKTQNARTAGTLTVECTVGGVATGLQAVIDGTNTTFKLTEQAVGADTFAAGDIVRVTITTASYTPTGATEDMTAGFRVSYTP